MYFDIHSHILPGVDDGAKDMEESIKLLEMMQAQGITHVLATPHFYPQEDNLTDFSERISVTYAKLEAETVKRGLPKIYLGCEMLYFEGIGQSESLPVLCLNGTNYLLLELTDECINNTLFKDIIDMRDKIGVIPIIAHVERYCKAKNYKKFIKFLISEKIPTQINASSVLMPFFKRVIKRLLKANVVFALATDAHSVKERPPLLIPALRVISDIFGDEYRIQLIKNSTELYKKIILRGDKKIEKQ